MTSAFRRARVGVQSDLPRPRSTHRTRNLGRRRKFSSETARRRFHGRRTITSRCDGRRRLICPVTQRSEGLRRDLERLIPRDADRGLLGGSASSRSRARRGAEQVSRATAYRPLSTAENHAPGRPKARECISILGGTTVSGHRARDHSRPRTSGRRDVARARTAGPRSDPVRRGRRVSVKPRPTERTTASSGSSPYRLTPGRAVVIPHGTSAAG